MSPPAVIERVRRMEETGVIAGYHADVNMKDTGLQVTAFIRLRCTSEKYPQVLALSKKLTEILERYHVSGGDSFILKVAVPSVEHLEDVIGKLSVFGSTATSIVMSSPVRKHEARGV